MDRRLGPFTSSSALSHPASREEKGKGLRMRDPEGQAPPTQRRPELSEELTRSLSSIWQRHAGERPSAANTELSGDVVRFVIQDVNGSTAPEPSADSNGSAGEPLLDSAGYKHEAIAAVAKITRRRVRAFISKRDKKTDVGTDTFILEPVHIPR
jgi:hypothetical protein